MYQKTRDLRIVKKWLDKHGGQPAIIKDTDILKVRFIDPNAKTCDEDEDLQTISWQNFCKLFEQLNLFFLYETQDNTEFYKIILDPSFDQN